MEPPVSAEIRVPPAVEAGAWQPMASAPRDGTTVLAWSEHAPSLHVVSYDREPPSAWVAESGEYIIAEEALQFWAPLPGAETREGSGRRAWGGAAWLASCAAAVLLCLLGMLVENAFDLLP